MSGLRRLLGTVWPLLLAIAVVVAAMWAGTADPPFVRRLLTSMQFWSLEILFVLVVALTLHQMPALMRSMPFRRTAWRAIAGCVVLAGILAAWVAPRTNRIFYDEQIYQGIGHNLADLRRAQMCHEGITEYGRLQCSRGEYNKQPNGYPHLLSVFYRGFGVTDTLAHRVNIGVLMAHVLIVALVAGAWLRDRWTAIAAAAVFASIPQQLQWSATAASEPSAAFACTLAVLAALRFTDTRSTESLLWTVVTTAWAVQFRPESMLIVPVVGLIVVMYAAAELRTRRAFGAAALGAVLLAVHIVHLMVVRSEGWGTAGDRFSIEFFKANLGVNGWFYLADWRFPAGYGLAAIAGVLVAGEVRFRLIAAAYFVSFWSVFLFFYAGSYNYGADVRYSLMTYAPLALLAGRAAASGLRMVGERPLGGRVAAVAAVAYVLLYMPGVRAVGEDAWAARADVEYARTFAAAVSPRALVLTHNPHMFHLWGRNAAQMSVAVHDPGFLATARQRYGDEIYLHWNYWCNVADPAQRDLCPRALEPQSGPVIAEHHERGYRFALIKLDPGNPGSLGGAPRIP
jgi:hypothetical protein